MINKQRLRSHVALFVLNCIFLGIPNQGRSVEIEPIVRSLQGVEQSVDSLRVSYTVKCNIPEGGEARAKKTLTKFHFADDEITESFNGGKVLKQKEYTKSSSNGDLPDYEVDPDAPPHVREQQEKIKKQLDEVRAELEKARARSNPKRREEALKKLKGKATTDTSAFDGESLRTVSKTKGTLGTGSIYSRQNALENQFDSLYFKCLGIELSDPTQDSERGRLRFLLADILEGDVKVEVVKADQEFPNLDSRDGIFTVTVNASDLEPSLGNSAAPYSMKAWLDASIGYAIRKFESFNPSSGQVYSRITNGSFIKITPDFWIPEKCVMEEFAPPHAKENSNSDQPIATTEVSLTDWSLEGLPEERYSNLFSAGMRITDFSRGNEEKALEYVYPANADELDEVIALASGAGGESSNRVILIIANVIVIAILVVVLVRARIMKSRS